MSDDRQRAPRFSCGLTALLACGAMSLAGCNSEPTCDYSKAPYQEAKSVPPLRAPDGLTTPDRSAALVVPATPGDTAPAGKGKCLDRPPSYFSTTPRPENSTDTKTEK